MKRNVVWIALYTALLASLMIAQEKQQPISTHGEKLTIKGLIVGRDGESITVRTRERGTWPFSSRTKPR